MSVSIWAPKNRKMDIWHICPEISSNLLLWRTSKKSFRVTQDGDYTQILSGGNYCLIHRMFEVVLLSVSEQVKFSRVVIKDHISGQVVEDYVELEIENEINPSTISILDSTGRKIWKNGRNIFVTGELKEEFVKVSTGQLQFSLGFSFFAG